MIRKFDRYLIRQVLATTIFAVVLLSGVLVFGNIFKQIHEILVERGAGFSFLWIFSLQLLPVSLVFTIPWGFLAAVLLVFGRLSGDQEINALRSSGMSLFRIAAPVILIGVALSMLCLWLNATVSPRSKGNLKRMFYEQLKSDPNSLLDPSVVQSRLKGQRIYVEERDSDNSLRGFHFYQIDDENPGALPLAYVYADHVVPPAEIIPGSDRIDLRLTGAYLEKYNADGRLQPAWADKIEPWALPLQEDEKRRPKPNHLDNGQIANLLENAPEEYDQEALNKYAFEAVRRYSFSLAPLALCLVGIPLALTSRRKESSAGIGQSLLVAFCYFLFTILAKEIQSANFQASLASLWLPNFVCLGLGIILFHRATRSV
jgi:lipopolysaccharide export system permease protein